MEKISDNTIHNDFQKVIAFRAKGVTYIVLGQVLPDHSGVTVEARPAQTSARGQNAARYTVVCCPRRHLKLDTMY